MSVFVKVISIIVKVWNFLMIAILVMLGIPLLMSIMYGTTNSEEVFVFQFWLIFYVVVKLVIYVIKLLIDKMRGSKAGSSKRKMTTEVFIKSIVDEIVRTDNKVDISEASYISLKDVKKLKEYIPIFRLHLLLIMLTKTSESVFDVSKRYTLLFEAIEATCIKYGLTEEESKEYSQKVHDTQVNYENKIGNEEFHKEDLYFHASRYFVDILCPDEPKTSDKYLGTMKMVIQIQKHFDKMINSTVLVA